LEEAVNEYFELRNRSGAKTSVLTDAALRAFPGAVVRGCRNIEMHTNRDDKRVSGMASNGPGRW